MSNNKVWVTWKTDQGEILVGMVTGLGDGADVHDLRKAFVEQLRWLDRDPATLSVFECKGSEKLEEDKGLAEYFATAPGSPDGPGKSGETALYLAPFSPSHISE